MEPGGYYGTTATLFGSPDSISRSQRVSRNRNLGQNRGQAQNPEKQAAFNVF